MGDYVGDFVAHLDCPLLSFLTVNLLIGPILDVPQLHQFISRAERLLESNHACVVFSDEMAHLTNRRPGSGVVGDTERSKLDVLFAFVSGPALQFTFASLLFG